MVVENVVTWETKDFVWVGLAGANEGNHEEKLERLYVHPRKQESETVDMLIIVAVFDYDDGEEKSAHRSESKEQISVDCEREEERGAAGPLGAGQKMFHFVSLAARHCRLKRIFCLKAKRGCHHERRGGVVLASCSSTSLQVNHCYHHETICSLRVPAHCCVRQGVGFSSSISMDINIAR